MSLQKLKWIAIFCFLISMVILLAGGFQQRDQLPPYPGKVAAPDGKVLFEKSDILAGQDVYQRYGLMDHGSIWGHGSQRGPEFSASTLHLIGDTVRDYWSGQDYQKGYTQLDDLQKAVTDAKTKNEIKMNRYDSAKDTLTLTVAQSQALDRISQYWGKTFKEGENRYGFLPNTVPSDQERLQISRFFFWTAWVASTPRTADAATYTNNWPPDRSIGNVPTPNVYFWSISGLLVFLIALGLFIFWVHHYELWYGPAKGASLAAILIDMPLTPSQLKAAKFFLVVVLLLLLQTSFGGLLAHYTVHPASFWFPIVAAIFPYSLAKTWHLQLAIFWIATSWVASAIYLAPIIGGREPRKQGLLVELLFAAILVVALGSLAGEMAGIKGLLGDWWFWFGHQGWEYLELGRVWQILLLAGLVAWLLIVYRAVFPHLQMGHKDEFNSLIWFYVLSAIFVVAFFGFGLFYSRGSHMTMADYWRWFVVHIWVEGIFEFFGVAAIAVLLVAMGLVTAKAALTIAYFTAAIVFLSGIVGTAHHYFWFGGPSYWLAWGTLFSSMEPIPLMGLVVRGMMEFKAIKREGKDFPYKWPLYFLVASSFWNFLGAGIFGFLINLPIVNYYEHGTYLTMNHGHTALFGTYGMLSIALLLFAWRGLVKKEHWNDGILKLSFFGLNGGLLIMAFVTLFPVGLIQAWISFQDGLWAARDASFFERTIIVILGNLRVIPDLIIIVLGVLPLAYFLFKTYPRLKAVEIKDGESVWDKMGIQL
ncbi:MAG: nitric-oxide reductase large subunit [Deltaproteobacteria bacterium]|nr:MAG: nitric-oxide reductase large subunit [Deltaproteobacteria bacterium]